MLYLSLNRPTKPGIKQVWFIDFKQIYDKVNMILLPNKGQGNGASVIYSLFV